MNESTWDIVKPIAAQAARDFLRTVGMYLAAKGMIQGDAGVATFIGAGMSLAGLFWGWFTTKGYMQVGDLLKKLTATKTPADAISTAQALPPASPVKVQATLAGTVVKVLLIAFALSFLVAGHPAIAQTKIKLPIDPLGLNGTQLTGNAAKDAEAVWAKIVAASDKDLAYSSAMAAAAGTNGSKQRKQCWDAILLANQMANGANVKNADGTLMAKPDPHLFADLESLAETVDNLSPQGALFTSCAGAAQLAKTNVLAFINGAVAGAAGLGHACHPRAVASGREWECR